jgi:hypothetical protein
MLGKDIDVAAFLELLRDLQVASLLNFVSGKPLLLHFRKPILDVLAD